MSDIEGVKITPSFADRIATTVRKSERIPTRVKSGRRDKGEADSYGLHLRVESHAAGGGKYNVTLMSPTAAVTIDPAVDATEAEIGVLHNPEAGITVIGINTAEIGTDKHIVRPGSIFPCQIDRMPTAADPVLVLSFTHSEKHKVIYFDAEIIFAPSQTSLATPLGNRYGVTFNREIGKAEGEPFTTGSVTGWGDTVNLAEPADGLAILAPGVRVLVTVVIADDGLIVSAHFNQPVFYTGTVRCFGVQDTNPEGNFPTGGGGGGTAFGGGVFAEINYHLRINRVGNGGVPTGEYRLAFGSASDPPSTETMSLDYWQIVFGSFSAFQPVYSRPALIASSGSGPPPIPSLSPCAFWILNPDWINTANGGGNGPCMPNDYEPKSPCCVPQPPSSGHYALTSIDGVIGWELVGECP